MAVVPLSDEQLMLVSLGMTTNPPQGVFATATDAIQDRCMHGTPLMQARDG